MKIITAESAGFCFGVKRALETVNSEIDKNDFPIYTYGPIIHNEIVVDELKKKGVDVMEPGEDFENDGRTVIIRSHGVPEKTISDLTARGCRIVNATCPFVQKIQHSVKKYDEEGYNIVITGDDSHPEVQGIIGWIPSGKYTAIQTAAQAEDLPFKEGDKVCVVSQTTFNYNKFEDIVEIIKKKGYHLICLNTICNATEERQKEARDIAEKVDVMIVIGGKHSSNSQKLYEICKEENPDTYFIQQACDLDFSLLKSIDTVGITAGASTPDKIIEEVQGTCQKRALNRCLKHQ